MIREGMTGEKMLCAPETITNKAIIFMQND